MRSLRLSSKFGLLIHAIVFQYMYVFYSEAHLVHNLPSTEQLS